MPLNCGRDSRLVAISSLKFQKIVGLLMNFSTPNVLSLDAASHSPRAFCPGSTSLTLVFRYLAA